MILPSAALAGAAGALAFAVLIRVPKTELPLSALTGLVSGGVFAGAAVLGLGQVSQVFLAAVATAALSEGLARWRRVPATVYVMPGLIPLVPGLLAYRTMYDLVQGQFVQGAATGLETLFWAGAIGVGIALVLTLLRMVSPPPSGRSRSG
ncbi:MAG: threonine/serine exporter family protein [Thermaerobacter sp.]|nr:threonine/serine exporter family protein [Thermaerobacter sp.]